jgi:hypothetical protein
MLKLILAQLSGFATRTIMQVIVELANTLIERPDSSMNKDGKKIVDLIKKNAKEDKAAGFSKLRAYANQALK